MQMLKVFSLLFLSLICSINYNTCSDLLELLKNKLNNTYTKELHKAVKHNDVEKVKLLLKQGVDINAQNDKGQTVLMLAMSYKFYDIIGILQENKPNMELKDKNNMSAISYLTLMIRD